MHEQYFNKTFCLEVWGDYACFTRPEMKVERVSYDVITPSSARAIFEAVFWKPAIKWLIKKIEIMNPIKWISVRRNEIGATMSERTDGLFIEDCRQQRAGLFLRDVKYRLYAEIEFIPVDKRPLIQNPMFEWLINPDEIFLKSESKTTTPAGKDENPGKYNAIFERRAKRGQCFTQPYFGCREFSCMFKLIDNQEKGKDMPINETRDLGFMLYDMDFSDIQNPKPNFFRAKIDNGVVHIPAWSSEEVRR